MTEIPSPPVHDAIVVGAGPAGVVATLALRQAGLDAICVGPALRPDAPDRRTTALLDGSIRLLSELGLWDRLAPHAAPLRALHLIDRTGRLFRAPDVSFGADEIGTNAFGYNIANMDLLQVLLDALGEGLKAGPTVCAVDQHDQCVCLALTDGTSICAKLIVGADGRQSFCRETAGIGVRRWRYDQTAIVCNLRHSRPHENACTEFHYAAGPLTLVPLPGPWSSLVWVQRSEEAVASGALDDDAFADALCERIDGLLGDIIEVSPRSTFPLSGLLAHRLTGNRIALVGEAAHVIPPIGAQGLNLGFRDVRDLTHCVSDGEDPGSPVLLTDYERSRRADVWTRTLAADLLNRTLISNIPLLQIARSAGLSALSLAAPLRRAAMRQGMSAISS